MTAKQKLAAEAAKIDEFMDYLELDLGRKWQTIDEFEKVIEKINKLKFSVIQASICSSDVINHTISFVDTLPPFKNTLLEKPEKSRLDAIRKGVLLFINNYEPRTETN